MFTIAADGNDTNLLKCLEATQPPFDKYAAIVSLPMYNVHRYNIPNLIFFLNNSYIFFSLDCAQIRDVTNVIKECFFSNELSFSKYLEYNNNRLPKAMRLIK